jgi:hypothetical protein
VKWVIRNVKRRDARRILAKVLRRDTADEVSRYVNQQLIEAGLERVVPSRQVG